LLSFDSRGKIELELRDTLPGPRGKQLVVREGDSGGREAGIWMGRSMLEAIEAVSSAE
jgi:hypothetical protein